MFISPMVSFFNCSVTEISIYFTFAASAAVLSSLFGARILKRSMRATVIVASTVMGLGYIALASFPAVPMVWVAGVIAGLCFPLCTTVLAPIAINNWFAQRQGTYVGIVFAMIGVFGMILSPIFTALIASLGWQAAMIIAGVLVIAISVFVALFLLREDPESQGLLPMGAEEIAHEEKEVFTAAPAQAKSSFVRSPAFVLCAVVGLIGGFFGDFNSQLNTVVQKSGFDAVTAGFALSCASAGLMVGKILMGWVKDRKGSTFAIAMGCIFGVVAFATVVAGVLFTSTPLLYVGCFLTGFCTCLGTLTPALMASETFEPQVYANAVAYITAFCNLGMAIGIPFYTLTFDLTGSFMPILFVCIIVPVITIFIAATAIRLGKAAQAAA
ncbi:MAG: MFS transporter [Eggerthellaceae bacterium]|nr:MFS transporter [Eggerthellaceae bacterium]